MGKDKSLLDFKGKSLIKYQYDRLLPIFEKVYISTKEEKFDFDAPLIIDSSKIYAPTPVFLDIFKIVDKFFAISVDAPFIDEDIINRLIKADNDKVDATIAKTNYTHPLIGIYHKSILSYIQQAISNNSYKLNKILQEANTNFIQFEDEEKFLNLNYPHEFEKALQKL